MHFNPPPPNDFEAFFEMYFERCRQLVPEIVVIAAKWRFEDLIPGLSDFDTRFVVRNGMPVERWQEMSLAVGKVHTALAIEHPSWARNLEHLPGVNLTVGEITDPAQYYPEFSQWTFYLGDKGVIAGIESSLAARPWGTRDEIYHLKRIATFFGPYIRGIDPAVNVGRWENKYPLHSRFMHYFTPPVQSMVSLALRRNVPGKLEALRLAKNLFSDPGLIDLSFQALDCHYELPELCRDPEQAALETRLESYLSSAWAVLAPEITLIDASPGDTRASLAHKVGAIPLDPVEDFFSSSKFGRLMKGRLLFYSQEVPAFDSVWLIKNELGRIVQSFFHRPLEAFGMAYFHRKLTADEVLDELCGSILTSAEVRGMRNFSRIAGQPLVNGSEKNQARAVAGAYDPVLRILEKLRREILNPRAVKPKAAPVPELQTAAH